MPQPPYKWTPTDELRFQRLTEMVEEAWRQAPEGEDREELREALEDGDYKSERVGPETVQVWAGCHFIAEVPIWSLQRPDDPTVN